MSDHLLLLAPAIAVVAFLYASVGHGGASGYLAVLSLVSASLAPAEMRSTALTLNVLVAGTAWVSYERAGHFSWSLTWPFLAASVPMAFVGGMIELPVRVYAIALAAALAWAAYRIATRTRPMHPSQDRHEHVGSGGAVGVGAGASNGFDVGSEPPGAAPAPVPVRAPVALGAGGGIGLLSGIVGVGGGIFLSPIMLLRGWAPAKEVAATSAMFIVVNSLAGLAGQATGSGLQAGAPWALVPAAFVGGLAGSLLGARRFSGGIVEKLLAAVLVVAALKLGLLAAHG